ncbi:MAG: ABC transporter ATP-binding protein [Clostridia bacterium]|nr:ABC transporter ATP-binding protein [Clostridia bacterium]
MIEINNINKYYTFGGKRIHVLKDISLTVGRGELVAVTGASGSGKSTLMNIIGCLDCPDSGVFLLNGKNTSAMSERSRAAVRNREIGFVFQGFNLIPALTAEENVQLPLMYRHISLSQRREFAHAALKLVGLEHRMGHKPYELSGGQQQRVAIARAIAAKPPMILADEPTGNLDSESGRVVLEALLHLHTLGRTVVLITHDAGVASIAKRQVVISDGKIV